ncbi:Cinnamyl-alcohol dehydrogenase Flavonol reductase/cinnamoyl-CoA reductase [Ancistrocladus abbreviatus]
MASAEVEFRCFVGGLAWATDDQTLGRAFSQFGEVLESKVRLARDQIRSGSAPIRLTRISDLFTSDGFWGSLFLSRSSTIVKLADLGVLVSLPSLASRP